jgi:cation transporter-like permease
MMIRHRKHTISKREIHQLSQLKRHRHHPIIHHVHRKHRLSYKTIFYMKEYGPRSHISWVIIRESIKMLLLASLLSSLGGLYIKGVEDKLVTFLPLLILLPALTDMIGDFGCVLSSKFTSMLFLGKIRDKWWKSPEVRQLLATVLFIALISVFFISPLAYLISFMKGFEFTYFMFFKVLVVAMLATFTLIAIILTISVAGSYYIFKKNEDPNNMMIPITTAVADLGTMMVFTMLVGIFF